MNLFELFVKIGVDDQASGKLKDIGSQLGNGLKTAAKVGTAAVGVVSTAIVALGKIGLDYNSQMEQYTTNFTTMLGSQEKAVQKVQELKEFAASTPLSMDDLAMGTQTLLAFGVASENSTGILRQLGDIALGDADKMQRLSTAFGKATAAGKVTGDTVQQMIDAGWNPLIQISKAAGETMEETQKRMSAGKISVEELQAAMEAVTSGTGQFAGGMEEASHTTQGLISTLQDNAKALVGEVYMPISEGLKNTVLPSAINAISTLSEAFKENGINGMIDAAGKMLGSFVNSIVGYAPKLVDTAVTLVSSLVQGLRENQESIATGAIQIITSLATGILNMLPQIAALGIDLIVSLAEGIVYALPTLIEKIPEIVKSIVDGIITASPQLLAAAVRLVVTLGSGLVTAIPELLAYVVEIPAAIMGGVIDGVKNISEIGKEIVNGLWSGIESMGKWVNNKVSGFFSGIVDNVKNLLGIHSPSTVFSDVGVNIVNGVWEGIQAMGSWIRGKVSRFFSGIVDSVKGVLGIHSPSTVFASIGGFMAEGLGEGWGREYDDVKRKIEGGLDFGTARIGFTASGLTLPHSTVPRGVIGGGFGTNGDQEENIVIPVILDGKQIGEASYKYIKKKERMVGA